MCYGTVNMAGSSWSCIYQVVFTQMVYMLEFEVPRPLALVCIRAVVSLKPINF